MKEYKKIDAHVFTEHPTHTGIYCSKDGLIWNRLENKYSNHQCTPWIGSFDANGYLRITWRYEGEKHTRKVHDLIAETFLPNPNNLPQVNHINEIKTDNRLENLEWVSAKENCNHGTRNERMAKALSKAIIAIDKGGNEFEFPSLTQASETLGISQSCICQCCKGKQETSKGFKFQYA